MGVDGLRGEEVMAQVDVLGAVPEFHGHVRYGVALIVGRVVDEGADRPEG